MVAFIIFISAIVGLLTLVVVKLSISLIFWLANKSKDKQQVFKIYFPYYIITLVGLIVIIIIQSNFDIIVTIYFSTVYLMALLIWRSEIKNNHNKSFAAEPNHSNLP